MKHASAFKLVAAWICAGTLIPWAVIRFAKPLAGVTLLTLLAGALMVVVAPIAQLLIQRVQRRSGRDSLTRSTCWTVAGLLAVLFLMAVFGGFSFA